MGQPLKRKPPLHHARDLFGDFADVENFAQCETGFETRWQCPKTLGSGSMQIIKIRPGLLLNIGDFRIAEALAYRFDGRFRSVIMGFMASGSASCNPGLDDDFKQPVNFAPGSHHIAYMPDWKGISSTASDAPLGYCCLHISPPLLGEFARELKMKFPSGMRNVLGGNRQARYCQTAATPSAASVVVHQLLNCPYEGALRRLYYESKTLELVTYGMAAMTPTPERPGPRTALRPEDEDRARHVRNLLDREYQNPPRLMELARSMGVSHPKLTACFQGAYGLTIFEYLREVRLNTARALLEAGRSNVTEAAFEVGYSSLSHFSKAFREHFGASPGSYFRKMRQCR